MSKLLDNVLWATMTGPHQHFACGQGGARRYQQGFSPILAFEDLTAPDFESLSPFCLPDEHFYCAGVTGSLPSGWQIDLESTMFLMVWDGGVVADEAPDALPLQPHHAPAAFELATRMRPGPFGLRTIELGEYFGYFVGEQLVAMAGERFWAGHYREISGVCTDPDFQGQGMARRLMTKLISRQQQRGQTSFLHVMAQNQPAQDFYLRMGFRDYHETPVRVVSRNG